MPGVYSIINLKNDFIYIGSFSKQGFTKRINMHKNHLKQNKHHSCILQRDWNKYKENNFIFKLLEICSLLRARELEQELINLNGVGIRDKSYNMLDKVNRSTLPKSIINKIKKAHRNPKLIISTNTSGYKGVCPYRNKWKASIFRYGKSYHIGYYKSAKEASIAYNKINKLTDSGFYKWWNNEYNENRKDHKYVARGEKALNSKLTNKEVLKIRKMYKIGKYNQTELGNKFKVFPSHICNIVNNRIYSWHYFNPLYNLLVN